MEEIMNYILLFLADYEVGNPPQLFLVSQVAIDRVHESDKSAKISLQPISVDIVPCGACVVFDRVLWLTPEIESEIRGAYHGCAVLWKNEVMIPLELALVKQKFKQAGYVALGRCD